LPSESSASAASSSCCSAAGGGSGGGGASAQTGAADDAAEAFGQTDEDLPLLVRRGREHAGARHFLFQKPFRRRDARSDNEHLDLWVRRFYLTTRHAFPTTHRRSVVVRVREVVLNPVEAAVAGLQERTTALRDSTERAAAGPDRGAEQGFTSLLQGVVDAAVSGGVSNYAPFLDGGFRLTHPEIVEDLEAPGAGKAGLIDELRAALLDQLRAMARGIRVHAVKCSEDMLPLHLHLCERFETVRNTMRRWGVA